MIFLNIPHSQRVLGFDFGIGGFGITKWTIMIYWDSRRGVSSHYCLLVDFDILFPTSLFRIVLFFSQLGLLYCTFIPAGFYIYRSRFMPSLHNLSRYLTCLRGWFHRGINCNNKAFTL